MRITGFGAGPSESDGAPDRMREEPGPAPARALIQAWLSPAFPVGAFAYSHGLEMAVERGSVRDRPTLAAWLNDIVEHGSLVSDLILLAHAWRAAREGRDDDLLQLAELSAALQPGAERHLEATQQGRSFLATAAAAWPCPAVERLLEGIGRSGDDGAVTYAVAVGAAAGGHAVPLDDVLPAYGLAFVVNLVSASIRLSVIGQTDGQHVIAALVRAVEAAATRAAGASLDDVASATMLADIMSLAHETQHTRLFRS